MKKRILLISLAIASLLSACGEKQTAKKGADEEFLSYLETATYPLETDRKLTAWNMNGGAAIGSHTDPHTFPSVVEHAKAVGVEIEYTFPTGNQKEAFNLLIASNDLPDMINYWWAVPTDFPGGPEKAISDGYIASLNEMIPKYMPNLDKFLKENESAARDMKTDGGHYYYLPQYAGIDTDNSDVTCGFMFRKDWLDDLGLPVPETWDEWYTTLKAFKEQKGADLPLSLIFHVLKTRGITNAFDFFPGFYVRDNEVKYGFVEPQYKEFLTEMNKWYNEGLLDPNIASIDQKSVDSKVIGGRTGASFGWLSYMLNWTNAARANDPEFELVAVPFPVKEKGDPQIYGYSNPMVYHGGWAINAQSPNKELAAKVLDYGFSPEGSVALNFGKENEHFVMEDGKYKKTDLINNNEEGLTYLEASNYYVNGMQLPKLSFAADKVVQFYNLPEQYAAKEKWAENNSRNTKLSFSVAPPVDKAATYAKLLTDIEAYADEMMLKFITGAEPLSSFDKYCEEMKNYNLDELVSITQLSYDNYMSR